MKNKLFITAGLLLIILSATIGCNKEIEHRNRSFEALNPISADTGAGIWKPVLISSFDEFKPAEPLSTQSPQYKLELVEIKSWQDKISDEEQAMIDYWSAGTVLRWNEILRELVAKYNLPPYQNSDGTYPVPNSNNPLAYPFFPFANPPYAARAYAYVSAAQYDALLVAYRFKGIYKRPRPSVADAGIRELIPVVKDYAYPSEEAVAAGAAAAMLSLMFPGEQAYIQNKLTECTNFRILAGANTRSETEAGIRLGKAVAEKFINRARNDRAGRAVGTKADWDMLVTKTESKGEIAWKSLETPARPPMLPLFGKTIGFLVDTNEVVSGRPAPPPSTNSEQFKKELEEVLWYSQNPTRERTRIVHFWADGAGTYTPPGHWNEIASEDFVKLRISEVRWARNLALLNMAMFDAAICCWDAKYFYFNPRPSQVDSRIKTHTGMPNFPAYTSGHSTFSGAAAVILGHLSPANAAKYEDYAKEASLSRLYGAIHYRSDIEVGMQMGISIGGKAVQRAKTDGAE